MSKKLSLAILLSGNGSNFQAIVDSIENGRLKAAIKIVISNNKDAFGLKRAKKHNIKNLCLDHKDFEDRKSYDQKLKEVIKQESVDFIILAGFMRILGSDFVKNFPNKIINIHPSLLPKYPGLNTHQQAIDNQDSHHGISIHYVTEELDGGPIIAQGAMELDLQSSLEEVINQIHRIEHALYPRVIAELLDKKVGLKDNTVQFSHDSEFKDAHPLQFN